LQKVETKGSRVTLGSPEWWQRGDEQTRETAGACERCFSLHTVILFGGFEKHTYTKRHFRTE